MKLDSNNKMIINDDDAESPEELMIPHLNTAVITDEIIAMYSNELAPGLRNGNVPDNLINIVQSPQTRTPANSFSENAIVDEPLLLQNAFVNDSFLENSIVEDSLLENATVDDIDPASDLGTSIRNKCLELEEILQSLKSRLNHVVLGDNIVLSPEANSMEAQLEHDLDTDCQEDISLQEFLELLHSQNKISAGNIQ